MSDMSTRRGVVLSQLVRYCDGLFQTRDRSDWDGAWNGLQVENRGRVHKVAAAVDARRATMEAAREAKADLLLVHHGLFWGSSAPWTGSLYQTLRLLLDHDLAVYSMHLPLDEHPRLGNNILLCRALRLRQPRPFFTTKGREIGFQSTTRLDRDELAGRLAAVTGCNPLVLAGGPRVCRRIGVVTGGAGAELRQAAAEGVDTFITGEGPHWTHAAADDLGLNVMYGGHYATETLGVKALAAQVARRFRLPWVFLDHPTGL
jgi:dinuclear metal center YbgI/SA1388 family protein